MSSEAGKLKGHFLKNPGEILSSYPAPFRGKIPLKCPVSMFFAEIFHSCYKLTTDTKYRGFGLT